MFETLLVANRGEIAVRIIRTAKRLGLRTVAIYSEADRNALHVASSDQAYLVGPPRAAESYLSIDRIIAAARDSGANAIHPGYGFLSENAEFADAVAAAGLIFVGPPASAIRAMGLKDAAKSLMEKAGVPVVPGYHGERQDLASLTREAGKIGYPVLIKARAGGGGKGMRRVDRQQDFAQALESAKREAEASFGDAHVLLERYVAKPRHIEVQVFADALGNVIHLGERDCSLQRRHQKVIEEAPAPGMTPELRERIGAIAVRAARAIDYRGAGTVEFIADTSRGLNGDAIYFMEMNTRLQVEHPVTEAITGLDLVEWQLRVAAGETLPLKQNDIALSGHAFEARVYAEDAEQGFLPAAGTLDRLSLPEDVARVDAGVRQGDRVEPHYDPLIAKIIAHAATRDAALQKLSYALANTLIHGTKSNVPFLRALAKHPQFQQGDVDTGLIERDLAMLIQKTAPSREAIAAAAIAALDLGSAQAAADPWRALSGWRNWGSTRHSVDLEYEGRPIAVEIAGQDGKTFSISTAGNDSLDVVLLNPPAAGSIRIETDGRVVAATAAKHGSTITIVLDGDTHVFTRPDHLAAHEDDEVADDRIVTPMPGLIRSVTARAGETVSKGQALAVIEAMKMEFTMTSPRDGKIAEVFVRTGASVEAGAVLMALEPVVAV